MPELDPADTYNTYELSPVEHAEFGAAVAGVTADPYASFEDFLDQVRQAGRLLPDTVARVLRDFAGRRLAGALLLRNLPMPARPPDTPLRPFLESGMTPVGSERVLAACVLQVGEPFSYEQWDGGYLVHNKYPIRAHREIQFGSNAVEFLVHTETPFREPSPDFLALGCVRGDPTGVMAGPVEGQGARRRCPGPGEAVVVDPDPALGTGSAVGATASPSAWAAVDVDPGRGRQVHGGGGKPDGPTGSAAAPSSASQAGVATPTSPAGVNRVGVRDVGGGDVNETASCAAAASGATTGALGTGPAAAAARADLGGGELGRAIGGPA